MTNLSNSMQKVESVVRELEEHGFDINRVSVGNGQRPVIWLFRNSKCDELIKSGKASYKFIGNKSPIKQGMFYHDNCYVVWSESLH